MNSSPNSRLPSGSACRYLNPSPNFSQCGNPFSFCIIKSPPNHQSSAQTIKPANHLTILKSEISTSNVVLSNVPSRPMHPTGGKRAEIKINFSPRKKRSDPSIHPIDLTSRLSLGTFPPSLDNIPARALRCRRITCAGAGIRGFASGTAARDTTPTTQHFSL
jgi:hypothetical protein